MGRVVVVTGGGTGIGKAIAAAFARAGDSVVITGRREQVLAGAAAELGDNVRPACFDATDSDHVRAFANGLDRIDVLVNNAGGNTDFDRDAPDSLAAVAANWRSNFDANVLSAVLVTTACLDRMQSGGSIITIGSIAADKGAGAYGAAKAAIASWNIDLARQVGPRGLTANVIAPGFIADTEFFRDRLSQDRHGALVAGTFTGRAGSPADIAACATYLASPGARQLTGQVLSVNGGELTSR
ncbi:SDR family oxidoreductase [Rhodococcus hoagii]|nr:SDR family oxidoreductase [Prescottella equi]